MNAKRICGMLLMGLLLGGASDSPGDDNSGILLSGQHHHRHRQELEGSWHVSFSFTFPPGFPPGQALYTFAEDGALVMTANNVDPRIIGPGHGAWTKTGDHEFGLTFLRMRFDPTTTPPTYLGTLKSRWAPLQLNDAGDEWTSDHWVIDFYDPDGKFIQRAFEGNAKATRIAVESPD